MFELHISKEQITSVRLTNFTFTDNMDKIEKIEAKLERLEQSVNSRCKVRQDYKTKQMQH